MLHRIVQRWQANTISGHPRLEVVSALVIAPLVEEAVFRLAVDRLAGVFPMRRTAIGVGGALVFGLSHVRFGWWFVGYAFLGGVVLWSAYARAGYRGAVLLHVFANMVDLSLGWRRHLAAATGHERPP